MTASPNSLASLRFLGATGTVTGSRFLVDAAGRRTLVDCGLFQGLKSDRLRNWQPFPIDPATIDDVVVTHAHIDHSGYLPRLVRDGFTGRILCSEETASLVEILLADCGRLQEEEADWANRVRSSKHDPALPLYTEEDAAAACSLLAPVETSVPVELGPGTTCTLENSGHILGARSVHMTVPGSPHPRSLVFSGDLGRPSHPLLRAPTPIGDADVLVVESTYGDRRHRDTAEEMDRLARIINETAADGGTVVIPAFAVDRTEVVLHALDDLERRGSIPRLPIFVDSPMALAVLGVYRRAAAAGAKELRTSLQGSPLFERGRINECHSTAESKALADLTYPSIIISASGMATGGRVLHHLARLLPDRRNTVVLTGFQADGTRGWRLQQGERAVKIFGQYVPVRAGIEVLDGFSVHADSDELMDWLRTSRRTPDACYVVHGSPPASEALVERIETELDWLAVAPRHGERVIL